MKRMNKRLIVLVAVIVFQMMISSEAFTSGDEIAKFPTKPINLIVPFAPGGSTDISARALAKGAEKYLGQPIVILNQPGGGGSKGPALVAKEKPDGYTLGTLSTASAVWTPLLIKVPYDTLKDFTPIIQYGDYLLLVSAKADAPFKTGKQLIEYSRQHPGLAFSCVGTNHIHDTVQKIVAKAAGVQWRPVAFDGSISAITALLGGHVSFVATIQEQLAYIKTGQLIPIVAYSDKRSPLLPDVPTWRELGYDVGTESSLGIVGPAGIPKPVVNKLVDAFKRAMDSPEFVNVMKNSNIPIVYRGPEEFSKYNEDYTKRTYKMLKEIGVKMVKE